MRMCPCKGCGERTAEPNCHDRCPVSARGEYGYDEWKREMQARNDAQRKSADAKAYKSNMRRRLWKKSGWRPEGER